MKEADEHKWANWLVSDQDADPSAYSEDEKIMSQFLQELNHVEVPPMDEAVLMQKIQTQIQAEEKPKSRVVLIRRWIMASAAILVLAMLFTFLVSSDTSISTIAGEIKIHTLPDHSIVTINGTSSLKYASNFNENRVLQLEGEAFFEVEKGSRFTVETANGSIEVLGTSFNVHSYDQTLTVTCKTGKVRVYNLKKESIDLLPGDLVRLDKEVIKRKIESSSIAKWNTGKPYFSKAPLKEVVASLKSAYAITIDLPTEHQERSFTGSFVMNDIDKALKMVFLPMEIPYTLENNSVVF